MRSSFQSKSPTITCWVKESGTVEIGYDPTTDTFSQALENVLE